MLKRLLGEKIGKITFKKKGMIGQGTKKSAFDIFIKGKKSNEMILIESPYLSATNSDMTEDEINEILDNQEKAHSLGYAPKLYGRKLEKEKFSYLTGRVEGEQICTLLDKGEMTKDKQKKLLECYLELAVKKEIYQEDTNCENIYFTDTNLTIIDDITSIPDYVYDNNNKINNIVYFILDELNRFYYTQDLPLKTFLYKWLKDNANQEHRKEINENDEFEYSIDSENIEEKDLPELAGNEKDDFKEIVNKYLTLTGGRKRQTKKQRKEKRRTNKKKQNRRKKTTRNNKK